MTRSRICQYSDTWPWIDLVTNFMEWICFFTFVFQVSISLHARLAFSSFSAANVKRIVVSELEPCRGVHGARLYWYDYSQLHIDQQWHWYFPFFPRLYVLPMVRVYRKAHSKLAHLAFVPRLYGAALAQTVFYFKTFLSDGRATKYLVSAMQSCSGILNWP